ncbi:hypothetical protein IM774_12160 [Erysipelotrichaceae bacterium RD49]|nr:hypothetical protein [Erysipelotrichaceae bacterium RD49]
MTHTTANDTLKSRKDTKACKFIAMAMSLSVAAIVGYAIMKPAPAAVQAHAYTSENKVAVVANEQKVEKINAEENEQAAANVQEAEASSEAAPEETPAEIVETPAVQPAAQPEAAPAPIIEAQPVVTVAQTPAQPASETFEEFEEVESTPVETPAPAQPASLIGSDGIWHITYVPAWGAGSAPVDGSIGIWADGWFIAHSGMINGDTIASLPQYVEVDGQVYTMTDTWVSSDSVDANEIARARANNGIVFQTCITETTNRLVHYEPVNGAGYAYQFTNFPFTTQDAAVFGV